MTEAGKLRLLKRMVSTWQSQGHGLQQSRQGAVTVTAFMAVMIIVDRSDFSASMNFEIGTVGIPCSHAC